eukprot:412428-Prymnesium_polylepis.1
MPGRERARGGRNERSGEEVKMGAFGGAQAEKVARGQVTYGRGPKSCYCLSLCIPGSRTCVYPPIGTSRHEPPEA